MRPRRYFVGGNAGTEAPSNLLFFDSETHRQPLPGKRGWGEHRLRLWSAIALRMESGKVTRRVTATGTTAEEFWDFLDSRCHPRLPLWAFAHSLGFDLTTLDYFHQQRTRRYTIGPVERPPHPRTGRPRKPWIGKLCLEARPTFLVCRGPGGTVKMVCTGNYWADSVESLGPAYGLAKLPLPAWDAPAADWQARCDRDCHIIEAAVLDLIRRWVAEDNGTFQLTAPALAMRNFMHTAPFRAKGKDTPNLVIEPEHPAIPTERESYYGPRFEAYRVGEVEGPVYKLDVNGAYLHAMETGLVPCRHAGPLRDLTPDGLWRASRGYGVVARVALHSPVDTYPLRCDRPACVLYPVGKFWTVLAGPELQRAIDLGHVKAVTEAHLYELGPLFAGWAAAWHERKIEAERQGDTAGRTYAKLVGLSLYGKFSQRNFGWQDRPDLGHDPLDRRWCVHDRDTNQTHTYRAVAGVVQEWAEQAPPRHLFPAISAYVAGQVREYMRGVIAQCPRHSVYYMGADSLLVSELGYQSLLKRRQVHPERLGAFKLEGVHASAEIRGPNVYRLGDAWVQAGNFGRPRTNATGKKTCLRFEKLPGIIARIPDGTVREEEIDWAVSDVTPRGTVAADGWVLPVHLAGNEHAATVNREPVAARGRRKGRPS